MSHQRRIACWLAVAALSGCVTSGMPASMQRTIPKGASAVTLRSTLTPPAMFASAQAALFEMGFSFTRVDSSGMNLETDAAPVGSSKSPLRVTLHVESNPTGSLLTITGRTPVAGGVWGTATNSHTDGKARLGFEEMVLLLVRLPHREIQYPLAEAPR